MGIGRQSGICRRTPDEHQIEILDLEQRTVCRNMLVRFSLAVADKTDTIARKRLLPSCLQAVDVEISKPLERVIPFLALLVGTCQNSGWVG